MVQRLGKYQIIEKIGEGPLGAVYKATDDALGCTVAVRVISEGMKWNLDEKLRFCSEYRVTASLQHKNIAAVLDLVEDSDAVCIVTDFLQGKSLKTLLDEKSEISEEDKLSIITQIVEGLAHAHKCGILHRDLKPGNIFLGPDGIVKILNPGLAFSLSPYLARPSIRYGAPIYLSPEQVQGKSLDERSEIFSMGTVFCELVTGVHPFHNKDGNRALDNILYAAPIPEPERFPDIPAKVWSIISTCLAKSPDDRYGSMADLAADCREAQEEIAEDVEFMQIELQMALPRLRKAACSPGAPGELSSLLKGVQGVINGEKRADYGSLNRLMRGLSRQYPTIKAASRAGSPVRLPGGIGAEADEKAGTDDIPAAASPSVECSDGAVQPAQNVNQTPEHAHEHQEASLNAAVPQPSSATEPESPSACEPDDIDIKLPAPHESDLPLCGVETGESRGVSEQEKTTAEYLFSDRQACENPDNSRPEIAAAPEAAAPGTQSGNPEEEPVLEQARQPAKESDTEDRSDQGTIRFGPLQQFVAAFTSDRNQKKLVLYGMWASIGLLVLLLALSIIAGCRVRGRSPMAVGGQERQQPYLSAGDTQARGGPTQEEQRDADILFREARKLADQGRFDEAKILIRRLVEIRPMDSRAVAALKEFEERSTTGSDRQQEKRIESLLSGAAGLIRAGNLQAAKSRLDQVDLLHPNLPETAALRKRWEAKNSEITRDLARKDAERSEAAQLQKSEQALSHQVEYLYRLGKYAEAQSLLDRWSAENPKSPQALEWRAKAGEAQRVLKEFNSSFNEKRYEDALNALTKAEQMNPADPNLSELRRQVESRKAGAKATLTVYRLGEGAALSLDGRPLGKDGEAENESVPIGSHMLAVNGKRGVLVTKSYEFLDGQKVSFVYDTAQPALREMSEGDRELIGIRRTKEHVNRFAVEHPHGMFRGSCRGELLVSYYEVEYRPAEGEHGFSLPFRDFKLRTRGKSIELFSAAENKEFQAFKVQSESEAMNLRQLWDKLDALGKRKESGSQDPGREASQYSGRDSATPK